MFRCAVCAPRCGRGRESLNDKRSFFLPWRRERLPDLHRRAALDAGPVIGDVAFGVTAAGYLAIVALVLMAALT